MKNQTSLCVCAPLCAYGRLAVKKPNDSARLAIGAKILDNPTPTANIDHSAPMARSKILGWSSGEGWSPGGQAPVTSLLPKTSLLFFHSVGLFHIFAPMMRRAEIKEFSTGKSS